MQKVPQKIITLLKYTLHYYALPDQKNDLYGNIKATADLPCLACVIILF